MFTFPIAHFASSGGDPEFSNVSLLLLFKGDDGDTTFTDSSSNGHTVTTSGDVQIDTAHSKFDGSSGLWDGSGDLLTIADHASLDFPADFTIEMFVRLANTSVSHGVIGKLNTNINANDEWRIFFGSSNNEMFFQTNGNSLSTGALSFSANTWYYLAVKRSGTTTSLWLDGVQKASNSSDSKNYTGTHSLTIGDAGNVSDLNGWLDCMRITKGVARDVSVIPTEAFPSS